VDLRPDRVGGRVLHFCGVCKIGVLEFDSVVPAHTETDSAGSTSNAYYHEYVFFAGRRVARSDPSSGSVYYFFVDQVGSTRIVTWPSSTPLETLWLSAGL
jgi:hypothetical protein